MTEKGYKNKVFLQVNEVVSWKFKQQKRDKIRKKIKLSDLIVPGGCDKTLSMIYQLV